MVVTLDLLSQCFYQYNFMYFDNELPTPNFGILHSFRTCGFFEYTKGGWFDKNVYNPIISITDYYDFTLDQLEELMCHEMIHYYLAYTGKDRNCRHGKEFKKMARIFELNYKIHITSHVDLTKYERRKGTPSLEYWWTKLFC